MNTLSAAPGSVLRQYDADGEWKEYPIIGWNHVQGNIAFPIFPLPQVSVGPGSAIFIPTTALDEGVWCYPHKGWVTEDEATLEGWVSESLGEAPEEAETKPAPKGAPITADGKPDTRPLQFGAKTYNTKSFWHWEVANAVFEIEGKEPYPTDPRAVKIKREEFAKLKRDGAVKIDPHAGLIIEETPAEQTEDEEDDVSGLI